MWANRSRSRRRLPEKLDIDASLKEAAKPPKLRWWLRLKAWLEGERD